MGSVCVLGHTFNIQSGSLQLCLSLHFLFVQNLKVRQTLKLRVFLSIYAVKTLKFPGICGRFSKFLFPKVSHSPAILPKISDLFTVYPNFYPLLLAARTNVLAFKCFNKCLPVVVMSVLGEFQINLNKSKSLELVLQGATRQVQINKTTTIL